MTSVLALRVLQVLLGAAIGVLISRALEPAGRGEYAVLVTIATTTVAIGHLSVEQAQMRLFSDSHQRRSLAMNALVLSAGLGVLLSVAAVLLVLALGPDIVPVSSTTGLVVAAAGVPVNLAVLWTSNLLVLAGRTAAAALAAVLASAVQLAVLVAVALAGRIDVLTVVALWAGVSALPLLVIVPLLRPRLRSFSWTTTRHQLLIGSRYHAGFALLFLLFRVDVFFLNGLSTVEAIGLYTLAVTLAELVYLLSDSIAQVLLSRQVAAADTDARASLTAYAVRLNLLGGLLVALALGLTSWWLVPFVYGQAFAGSVQPLLWLLPGVVAYACCRSVAAYLTLLGRPLFLAAASASALVINIALNLVLIPEYGASGAAAATTASYTVLAVLMLTLLVRTSSIVPRQLLPRMSDYRKPKGMDHAIV